MVSAMGSGLVAVLNTILTFVQILVFASVLLSWVSADPGNPIVRFIEQTTEPIYRPIRKLTANLPGPLDWAPFVVLLIVIFLQRTLAAYARM